MDRSPTMVEPSAEPLFLRGPTVITPFRTIREGAILIRGGRIEAVGSLAHFAHHTLADVNTLDCFGEYAVPGFVDIHVHGGGGADTADGTREALHALARFHARGGTTSLLATLLSSNAPTTERAVEAAAAYMSAPGADAANVVGVHLEGPFLAPARAGAQNPAVLRSPTAADIEQLLMWKDIVRVVTVAPEIEGGLELGEQLASHGIIPSIGHSDAYYADVIEAVEAGFRSVTHLYCDTSHWINVRGEKTLGLTETALLIDELHVELIADGRHVSPPLLQLAYKTKGADRISLVTDAIWVAGMPPGRYQLGGIDIVVTENGARRADETGNAGSVATMDRNVRTMVDEAQVPLAEVVKMSSTTPARLIDLDRGVLAAGKAADIALLDTELNVARTIVSGRSVYVRATAP